MKKGGIKHSLEALLAGFLLCIFKAMPLDLASAAGGLAGRAIGPRLGASRKALANLALAFPEMPEKERRKIVKDMWDNLGRVVGEYPHLEKIGRERVTLECAPETERLLQEKAPFMLIGAHLANWEIGASLMLARFNTPIDLTYRAPNNPHVDRMLVNIRSLHGRIKSHPKSREGGHEIIRAMRAGRPIGMLIDQKYNEGMAIPFFGEPAMTNPAFVQLGRKYDYPLIPARTERTGGAHFKVTFLAPLPLSGPETQDVIAQTHVLLEEWIRARPAQWLWLHRRWASKKQEDSA